MHIMQSFSHKINEISIRYKFLMIIFISNILIVTALSAVFSHVMQKQREMLYKETASRLTYTGHELEHQLDLLKSLSKTIVSSPEVQTNMNILRTSTNYLERKQASQELSIYLQQLQYDWPDDIVTFLSLQTPITSINTRLADADNVSEAFRADILQKALLREGIPDFTIHSEENSDLILSRSIRQASDLSLTNLGAVLIGIDLPHLMSKTMENMTYAGNQALILSHNNSLFYHSDSLDAKTVSELEHHMDQNYKLLPYNGKTYFAIKGRLSNYDWNYIYLLDYTNIQELLQRTQFFVILSMLFFFSLIVYFSKNAIVSILKHMDNLMSKIICFRNQKPVEPLFVYDYTNRKDELGALHNQFDAMTNRINLLIKENYKKEILKQQAELQALRAQINPHFLYNTLNSINWSAKAIGAEQISLMVESLGKILRMSISSDSEQFNLGNAVELQKAYLTIQKIRYKDRLEYEIQIPEEYYSVPIPRLILQPLVENAVRYGVEENVDPTKIRITAQKKEDNLCITIQNSGSEFPEDLLNKLNSNTITPHGFGIGLLNIHKRLRYTYGDSYGLTLDNIDELATVQVTIPISPKREEATHDEIDNC